MKTLTLLLYAAAVTLLLPPGGARAERYTAGGAIDTPNGDTFTLPMGFNTMDITGQSSMHGFLIDDGNPGQIVPLVDYYLELAMPGGSKIEIPDGQFNVVLNEMGEWSYYSALAKTRNLGVGDYSVTLTSEVYVNAVSKSLHTDTHCFEVVQ